uniref:SAND domain-containing protein n=1 Tax=Globodera pallida TaxID=36090 RepID=A0A183CI46_GLOPA
MASSFLSKSPSSFASVAHRQSPLAHNADTEYEKPSSSTHSAAPAFDREEMLAANNEAAMALSSLIEFGQNQQQMHRDGIGIGDCHGFVGCPPSPVLAVAAVTSPSVDVSLQSHASGAQNAAIKSEENESSDELPPADELASDAPVHEIRCGLLNARLHMQRFTCPGIHRKCVEFEGKLISPRQFTIKAEKDKQKDWKGSIRLGKHNLRTLMEMKTIDFYEHATNCSLKCQSRNYIKNRKSEGVGGGSESAMAFDGTEGGNAPSNSGGFDFCEATEVHSTTSSTSTRKSSAVLEDYVSQTIPSVNGHFVPLNLGTFCLNGEENSATVRGGEMAANGDEKTIPMQHHSALIGMNGGGVSALCGGGRSSSHHQLINNSSSVPTTTTSSPLSSAAFPPFGTSSTSNSSNSNGILGVSPVSVAQSSPSFVSSFGLLQQSPLKQLFTAQNSHKQQQLGTALSSPPSTGGLLPSHGTQQNGIKTSTTIGGGQSVGVHPAELNQQENNGNSTNTLALLLQSLQTSILLEQQQKAAILSSNSTNNNGNLAAFLNRIPLLNGGGGTVPQGTMLNGGGGIEGLLHRNGSMPIEQSLIGSNRQQQQPLTGIERLLNAAALLPQLNPFQQQQQRTQTTTTVKQEGNGGGGNVRKVMEENAGLFWSQMRSMGLLDDLLNTLSTTLERLKHIYVNGGNAVSEDFAARRLSGVALALDLCTLFSDKIHNRCIQATLETNLITKELLELQRKQEEQKRKLESAKRKSQMFELLKNGNGGREGESPPEMKKIHLNI